jgi:hypothetical protein
VKQLKARRKLIEKFISVAKVCAIKIPPVNDNID